MIIISVLGVVASIVLLMALIWAIYQFLLSEANDNRLYLMHREYRSWSRDGFYQREISNAASRETDSIRAFDRITALAKRRQHAATVTMMKIRHGIPL